jgi:hypothetical protein
MTMSMTRGSFSCRSSALRDAPGLRLRAVAGSPSDSASMRRPGVGGAAREVLPGASEAPPPTQDGSSCCIRRLCTETGGTRQHA